MDNHLLLRPSAADRLSRSLAAALLGLFFLPWHSPAQSTVGVVNAATYQAGFPLSPGCWATAFGSFTGVAETAADSVPFPIVLGGAQVFVNEVAAPMNYAGPGQINFLVPKGSPEGQVRLRISIGGATVHDGFIHVWPISPGLISLDPGNPLKPGAVRNQDGVINSQQNPARRGDVIQIFGVGADFAELPDDGASAPTDRLVSTATPVTAFVSVAEAAIQFSGLAPGLVNCWQLNITIPDRPFVTGQVPVVAYVRGIATNMVSVWVAP